MQKILNTKERWDAFLKFLFFFVITLSLVVSAIYFNFRLPTAENKILMAEKENLNQLQVNQDKFIAIMNDALLWKDSLLKENVGAIEQVSSQLSNKITELTSLSQSADDRSNAVNSTVVTLLNELSFTRKRLKDRDDEVRKILQEKENLDKQFKSYRDFQSTGAQ